MDFFKKAVARGLSPANITSWCSIKLMLFCGKISGTIRLRIKARILGVRLGRNVTAHGPVGIYRWPGGKISIADNVCIISSSRRATAASLAFPARLRVFGPGAEISIGEGCQLSGTSITARSQNICLGRGVMVAPNCIIVDSDFHSPWPPHERGDNPGYEKDAPVVIGDYAWIGMNSIILKGVSIGSGAIIGAGSVVAGSIPENAVACGTPARVVKILNGENKDKPSE